MEDKGSDRSYTVRLYNIVFRVFKHIMSENFLKLVKEIQALSRNIINTKLDQ